MTVPTRRPGPLDRRRFLLGAASVGAPSGSAPPRPPHARPGTGPTPPRGRRRLPGRQPPGALAAAGVTATFMVMGRNAVAPRSLLAEVVAGHEIGSHTWSHLDLSRITRAQAWEEIVRGKEAVEAVVQRPLVGFRPPRGELTGFALRG